MNPLRWLRGGLAALCILAFLVAPRAGGAAEPYDIYSITDMTGGLSFIGKAVSDALTSYEDAFNKSGGINGRPIHFVIEDAQTNPKIALQLVNDLLPKNLPFILGPSLSAECNAVFPLARNGPVVWCYSTAVNAQPGTYEFQTLPTNYDYNVDAMRWVRARGLTRIALISPTDATGEAYDRSIDNILKLPDNRALTLVGSEHFNPGDVSVAAQMSKIRASGAQVLFVGSAGATAATAFHGVTDAGLEIPVITGNGNASEAYMKQYAAVLPKELYVESTHCLAPRSIVNKAERAAFDAYAAAMTAHKIPLDCAVQAIGWDPALILTSALRKLGTNVTAEQLRTYVDNLTNFPGVGGTYDFKRVPQRGIDDAAGVIVRWDAAKSSWVPASKMGGAPL
jgi:branched-chain amino acid transport system substrate-binding protein